jgi:hypothetical protein
MARPHDLESKVSPVRRDWQGVAMAVCIALFSVAEYRLGVRACRSDDRAAEQRERIAAALERNDQATDEWRACEREALEARTKKQALIEELQGIAERCTSTLRLMTRGPGEARKPREARKP